MSDSLETLIRDVAERGLSISIMGVTANDHDGFSATTFWMGDTARADGLVNVRDVDPVAALRACLIEHLRRQAAREQAYEAAEKMGPLIDIGGMFD